MSPLPEFRAGEPLKAEHLIQLAQIAREALSGRLLSAPGVRLLQTPEGILPTFKTSTTTSSQPAFAPQISDGDNDDILVRFGPGLVEGIEPTINGTPISEQDADGETPALTVRPGDFAAHGAGLRCFVYFRYKLDPTTRAVKNVEPFAASKKPAGKADEWAKLVLILIRKSVDDPVRPFPMVVFNQAFAAVVDKQGGAFRPVPWAEA